MSSLCSVWGDTNFDPLVLGASSEHPCCPWKASQKSSKFSRKHQQHQRSVELAWPPWPQLLLQLLLIKQRPTWFSVRQPVCAKKHYSILSQGVWVKGPGEQAFTTPRKQGGCFGFEALGTQNKTMPGITKHSFAIVVLSVRRQFCSFSQMGYIGGCTRHAARLAVTLTAAMKIGLVMKARDRNGDVPSRYHRRFF